MMLMQRMRSVMLVVVVRIGFDAEVGDCVEVELLGFHARGAGVKGLDHWS